MEYSSKVVYHEGGIKCELSTFDEGLCGCLHYYGSIKLKAKEKLNSYVDESKYIRSVLSLLIKRNIFGCNLFHSDDYVQDITMTSKVRYGSSCFLKFDVTVCPQRGVKKEFNEYKKIFQGISKKIFSEMFVDKEICFTFV